MNIVVQDTESKLFTIYSLMSGIQEDPVELGCGWQCSAPGPAQAAKIPQKDQSSAQVTRAVLCECFLFPELKPGLWVGSFGV